ncbi:MAG: FMN-binding protein [Deltaproteobacteria bacterium]|jgi:NosR/NirI family transcriptional regulator, nitrous oxide reductase regulator|nr:FMN-binding protein [Deltaproteobacteria bacterium]MBT7710101.1 FMN-binding protein [Deltaproteobacteria bacterium]
MTKRSNRIESILALLTLGTLVLAAIIGFNRSLSDITDHFQALLPGMDRYEKTGFESYVAFKLGSDQPAGYIIVKKADGFGGPLKVAVSVDPAGTVLNAVVVEHRETPSWFKKVIKSPLLKSMKGKKYEDPFEIGRDVDGITGSTYTTRAVIQSVKEASREIALNELNLPKPDEKPVGIQWGYPEIMLVLLLAVAVFGIKTASGKTKKRIRWLLLLSGMFVIGFMVNHPLTLVDISKFLMGYWPDVHYQLYWYLLIFGVLLIFLTTNKNIYCHYICPFGAAQECLAVFGKARNFHSRRYQPIFKWLRRAVVWLAVFVGLIFRNPGISSYEVYSTLFSLSGTNREVLFLSIVLLVSLFVKRPWCKYLCPVPAFEDYLRWMKNRMKTVFRKQGRL